MGKPYPAHLQWLHVTAYSLYPLRRTISVNRDNFAWVVMPMLLHKHYASSCPDNRLSQIWLRRLSLCRRSTYYSFAVHFARNYIFLKVWKIYFNNSIIGLYRELRRDSYLLYTQMPIYSIMRKWRSFRA